MSHECPYNKCACVPCTCLQDDDAFYTLCTRCMFLLLPHIQTMQNHSYTFFEGLRDAFNGHYDFRLHSHKTLIVFPRHIMHKQVMKKIEVVVENIDADIMIKKLGNISPGLMHDEWKPWNQKGKRIPYAYAITPKGKVTKIKP